MIARRNVSPALLALAALGAAICAPHAARAQFTTLNPVTAAGTTCDNSIQTWGWPDANGNVLKCVSNVWTLQGVAATAAGSSGQVQFNSGGTLGASSNLFWNNSSGYLGVGTATPQSAMDVYGGVSLGAYGGTNAAPTNGLIVSGQVGIGTASPNSNAALDMSNNTNAVLLPVGTSGQEPTCNTAMQGGTRYNTTTGFPEFCNGLAWTPFRATGAPSGSGYFVLTSGSYNGNLGAYAAAGGNTGLAAGNAICLSELTTNTGWWGYASANAAGLLTSAHVTAFLCNGTTCNNLDPNTTYYFANAGDTGAGGQSFTTNSSGLGPNNSNPWGNAAFFAVSNIEIWVSRGTGTATQWPATAAAYTCTSWTTTSGSGVYGETNVTNSGRWDIGTVTCAETYRFICLVNP